MMSHIKNERILIIKIIYTNNATVLLLFKYGPNILFIYFFNNI